MMFLRVDGKPARHKLPNAVREAMLQAKVEKGLVVLEGLYWLGIADHVWLTFDQILRACQANFGMSRQLVYYGLREIQIFQRRKEHPTEGKRGARPYEYRIPHSDELVAEFAPNASYSPHDELEKSDLKNVSTYRKALHATMFRRLWVKNGCKGFEMSRKYMAERLGVTPRTVRTYDKELGFSNEPNYKEVEINEHNWGQLPRYKEKYDKDGKRLPSKQWLRIHKYGEPFQSVPFVRYLAYKALREGYFVDAMERLPNTYYPYLKPDPKQFGIDEAVERYLAEEEARNVAGFFQNRDGSWSFCRDKFLQKSPATATTWFS